MTKVKRRKNVNYTYNQFKEVERLFPKTSDEGERVNIFLTEMINISSIHRITSNAKYCYFKYQVMRTILSHNRYMKIIEILERNLIIERIPMKNIFNYDMYAFKPIFFQPIKTNVKIRNLKVRNAMRKFLSDYKPDGVNKNVKKWVSPGIIASDVVVSYETVMSNKDQKYKNYLKSKQSRREKVKTKLEYYKDIERVYYSLSQYKGLDPNDRPEYLVQDKFSGRIYNIATGLPKWIREFIRIDGEETVEIDMRSAHAVLLWKLLPKTDYIKFLYECYKKDLDIYTEYGRKIQKNERSEIKRRFLVSIYSKINSRTYKEFKTVFPEAGIVIDEIKTKMIKANPSKVKGFHTNLAYLLLNLEVKLFKRIWESLYNEGINFLSIHDGLLIPKSKADKALVIIREILKSEIPIAEVDIKEY